jgi:glycosyltransferase involved in cell wall biosynthesis
MDVVHVHGYHSSCGLGLALRMPAVPLVVSPHYHGGGHTSAARLLHVGYAPLGRRLLAAAGRVVAVSAAEQALLRRDVPALTDRVTVVHNGADTAAIAAAEPFDGEPPTVVVAGRLEPYKRVDAAIAAFAEVGSPAQLVIVGDGPDRRRLEALAEATARAKTVRFTGRVTDGELARWLRTARCVVSLSEHEAFGLVGLEASAAGARVVLSAIDAHREVAELLGAEVTLVESADRAAVTAALTAALAAPPEGPHPVRTWADVAADYLDIYAGLVTS